MLDLIYGGLTIAIVILLVIHLVLVVIGIKSKDSYEKIAYLKVRTIIHASLSALYLISMILSIALKMSAFSIGGNILCFILWSVCFVGFFLMLRITESEDNDIEIHVIITAIDDENEIKEDIDENYTEVPKENSNK